jgi:Coatomer (COPI) alpha subunit C-terminus
MIFSHKGAGWEVEDDDLELPEELASKITATVVKDGNYFTAPTKGVPPQQIWVNNSHLAADHVRSGSFDTAFRYFFSFLQILFDILIYFHKDCCTIKLVSSISYHYNNCF